MTDDTTLPAKRCYATGKIQEPFDPHAHASRHDAWHVCPGCDDCNPNGELEGEIEAPMTDDTTTEQDWTHLTASKIAAKHSIPGHATHNWDAVVAAVLDAMAAQHERTLDEVEVKAGDLYHPRTAKEYDAVMKVAVALRQHPPGGTHD